jgi:HK97 family phage major capsid protein
MEKELVENKIELRKLHEEVSAGKIKADAAKKKLEELRAKKAEIEKRIAQKNTPRAKTETTASFADIKKAMVEKRAITLNGTGAINQIGELVKELQKKTPLLQRVRYFYGPNAATVIPIFSPTIATPASYAEGTTNVPADTQAALGSKTLTPHAFVSLLPVSAETLALGSVNFEAELPVIFADAFAQGFHKAIATGTGTGLDFKGIFTAVASGSPAGAAPGIKALRDLALNLQDYTDAGVILLHPGVYSAIMADAVGDAEVDLYKETLIRDRRIEGVEILITSACPDSTAPGAVYAVGGRLENYGLAMASEIQIEPIKKVGDTYTYFQASVFANGSPILDKEFFGLKVPAAA